MVNLQEHIQYIDHMFFFGKRLVVRISTPLQTNVPPRNVHFGPWLFAIPKTQCITYITWYIDQHVDGLGDIGKYIIIIDGLSGYKKIILPTIYNIFRGIDFINHEISGCENLNQPGFYGSCHHVMSGLPLPLLGSFPQGSGVTKIQAILESTTSHQLGWIFQKSVPTLQTGANSLGYHQKTRDLVTLTFSNVQPGHMYEWWNSRKGQNKNKQSRNQGPGDSKWPFYP